MKDNSCAACKWWQPDQYRRNWGYCMNHLTCKRSGTIDFHKNFGCIHHEPKGDGDE